LDATAQILEIILPFYAKRITDPGNIGRQKQELFKELTEKGFARESQMLFAFDAIFASMAQPVHINLSHATLIESNLSIHSSLDSKPIAAALHALTQAIEADKQVATQNRAEALEKLSFIAKQAELPAPQRYTTILESALKSIPPG